MQGVENSNTSTLCPVSHCRVQIFLLLGGGARRGCLGSTVWASGLILSPFICCCHYSGVEQLLCSHLLHRGLSFECPPRQTEWCVLLRGQTEWCKVASFPLSLPGFLASGPPGLKARFVPAEQRYLRALLQGTRHHILQGRTEAYSDVK